MIRAHHVGCDVVGVPADDHGPAAYEIHVEGHLDARWAAWFDGLTLRAEADGTTVLHGPVVDQAALHGVLQRLRDLGVPLLSVTRVRPRPPAPPTTSPGSDPEGNHP